MFNRDVSYTNEWQSFILQFCLLKTKLPFLWWVEHGEDIICDRRGASHFQLISIIIQGGQGVATLIIKLTVKSKILCLKKETRILQPKQTLIWKSKIFSVCTGNSVLLLFIVSILLQFNSY